MHDVERGRQATKTPRERTLSRAQAVHALTPLVMNLEKIGGAAPGGLARLVDRARCYALRGSAEEMLDAVKTALRAA